jgi:hypothetical protein
LFEHNNDMNTVPAKRCTYCGKEYSSEVEICRLDGHALDACDQKEALPTPTPKAGHDRVQLILGLAGGTIGFILLLGALCHGKQIRFKLLVAIAASVLLACVCLEKLLKPLTSQLMGSPDEPVDESSSDVDFSASPLRCTYCGKRFPEGTRVCEIDAQPLKRI